MFYCFRALQLSRLKKLYSKISSKWIKHKRRISCENIKKDFVSFEIFKNERCMPQRYKALKYII